MVSKIPRPSPSKRCNNVYAFFVCSCAWIFKAIPKFSILHSGRYGEVQQHWKDFFRSSNHREVSALKQLFLKKHRIQLLGATGLERVK